MIQDVYLQITSPEFLRDWFACQAMMAIAPIHVGHMTGAEKVVADRAYRLADEMMKARLIKNENANGAKS